MKTATVNNTDFLAAHTNDDLILKSVEGGFVVTINPPKNGWTYDELTNVDFFDLSFEYAVFCNWDIYLGGVHLGNDNQWIFG